MELKILSLFSGIGGSSLGFHQAGYKEVLAIDNDINAVQIFKLNFPYVPTIKKDIRKITYNQLMNYDIDVIQASPPCQGFSCAGKRIINDERNDLYLEVVRLANDIKPKVIVIENVDNITKGKYQYVFNQITQSFIDIGYNVKAKIMNSVNHLVPQSRSRLIWICIRKDLHIIPSFPKPLNIILSVKDVLPYIEGMHRGQFDKTIVGTDRPCYTITKTPSLRFIINNNEVIPTIKELLLLSGFPSDFKLIGSFTQQWNRIGNAVMPPMMFRIAEHIKYLLEGYTDENRTCEILDQRKHKSFKKNSYGIQS